MTITTRVRITLLILLCTPIAFAQPQETDEPWTVDQLWGITTSLEDPRLSQPDATFSVSVTPNSARGAFNVDLRVIDARGQQLLERHDVAPDELISIDLRNAARGLMRVRATVTDHAGHRRGFETHLFAGDWERGMQSLGSRARQAMRDAKRSQQLDPLSGAALRFASHWSGRQHARFSERHTALLAQVSDAIDRIENHRAIPALTPVPMAIENDLAAEGVGIDVTRFWLVFPEGYPNRNDWPLVIFLHGSGGRSPDMTTALYNPVLTRMRSDHGLPCVLLIPKSDNDLHWNPDLLNPLLDWVLEHTDTDPDRVALTGLSMGGKGTWEWGMHSPERFSALVPACGNANPADIGRIGALPIWNTHGTADPLVDFYLSARLHDMLEIVGASDHRFDVRVGEGHNVWQHRYDDDAFWEWFLARERPQSPSVSGALVYDEDGLTAIRTVDTSDLLLGTITLDRAWDDAPPPANARLFSDMYRAASLAHTHESVHGPALFHATDEGTLSGFLLDRSAVPDDVRTLELPPEHFNRNMARDQRAVADTRDARTIELRPFGHRSMMSIFYAGPRAGFEASARVALRRLGERGADVDGSVWTRVWWDDWHDGTCLREIWVPVD